MTNLSRQLCEICGIKRKRKIFDQRCDNTCKYLDKTDVYNPCKRGNNPCPTYIKYVYPDFEQPENYKKLQEIFINHDHSITLSKGWYAISNGDTDFVNDMHDTSFAISGITFLKAVCNYLTLWIEETTQEQISYGIYSEPINTSHKLTREECIYPRGYDDLLKDVEKIKQAIRETEWVYE